MEAERMILDYGSHLVHIPGPGELVLPPGSVTIKMEKAPSGHNVIPIDCFDHVDRQHHALPETQLSLHAEVVPEATTGVLDESFIRDRPPAAAREPSTSASSGGFSPVRRSGSPGRLPLLTAMIAAAVTPTFRLPCSNP